jgi:hypothetical protein
VTAYIANHEKKNRIFAKRERALAHAIKHRFSGRKISIAAEKLREAKIAVFKCRFASSTLHEPHTFSAEAIAASNKHVQSWISMSTADIIAMYRSG